MSVLPLDPYYIGKWMPMRLKRNLLYVPLRPPHSPHPNIPLLRHLRRRQPAFPPMGQKHERYIQQPGFPTHLEIGFFIFFIIVAFVLFVGMCVHVCRNRFFLSVAIYGVWGRLVLSGIRAGWTGHFKFSGVGNEHRLLRRARCFRGYCLH